MQRIAPASESVTTLDALTEALERVTRSYQRWRPFGLGERGSSPGS